MAGDTDAAAPEFELDDEAKELKLQQAKAEARKAILEAEKAALTAALPTSDVKSLEGKVDVGEKAGLIADLVAHDLLEPAAQEIAQEVRAAVKGATARILIIEDRALAARDWPYQIVRGELNRQAASLAAATRVLQAVEEVPADTLNDAIEQFRTSGEMKLFSPATATVPLTVASTLISSVAGIVGLFRSDYGIHSREVTIGKTPLVAAVLQSLRQEPDIEVAVDGFRLLGETVIISSFMVCRSLRDEIERKRVELKDGEIAASTREIEDLRKEATEIRAEYLKVVGDAAKSDPLKSLLSETRRTIRQKEDALRPKEEQNAVAQGVVSAFDAFSTAVTAPGEEGSHSPLVAAALHERLRTGDSRYTHVLFVDLEAAGGETITRQNLFGSSKKVHFLGGCHVSYLLHEVETNKTIGAGSDAHLASVRFNLRKNTADKVQRIPFVRG